MDPGVTVGVFVWGGQCVYMCLHACVCVHAYMCFKS